MASIASERSSHDVRHTRTFQASFVSVVSHFPMVTLALSLSQVARGWGHEEQHIMRSDRAGSLSGRSTICVWHHRSSIMDRTCASSLMPIDVLPTGGSVVAYLHCCRVAKQVLAKYSWPPCHRHSHYWGSVQHRLYRRVASGQY